MSMWLLGQALSPLYLVLVCFVLGRPAIYLVKRYLPDGVVKRVLLLDRDKNRKAYTIGYVVVMAIIVAYVAAMLARYS